MTWTREQKINALMRLPWTVQAEHADDPDEYIVRVAELPGMIFIGTKEEVNLEFWPALQASLECYLEFEDENEIPLPAAVSVLPWNLAAEVKPKAGKIEGTRVPTTQTAFSQFATA